ncbi:MAG: FHA domain-containing protein [Prevotella sp.]|nr:FHA domain-containing protein [Prevotella sp.]
MKTITVGRGEGCNIIVDDEMMSRRHAIIKIPTFGGMEIVDMSKNGTFVNGVRLRPNVPFPITRKDVVNFADVHQLDWSKVPDPLKYYKIGVMAMGGLVVLLLAIFLLKSLLSGSKETPAEPAVEQVAKPVQTVEAEQQQELTEEKKEETVPEENVPEATSPEGSENASASKNDEVIDVYGAARASKRKREAEERARQQKAREAQKAKEAQKQQDSKAPSTSKPSGKNNNKTVVM